MRQLRNIACCKEAAPFGRSGRWRKHSVTQARTDVATVNQISIRGELHSLMASTEFASVSPLSRMSRRTGGVQAELGFRVTLPRQSRGLYLCGPLKAAGEGTLTRPRFIGPPEGGRSAPEVSVVSSL